MTNLPPVQELSEARGLVDTVPTEVYLAYEDRAKGIATRAMTETPAAIKNAILRFVLEARLSASPASPSATGVRVKATDADVERVARALAADELGMGDPQAVVATIVEREWRSFERQARVALSALVEQP